MHLAKVKKKKNEVPPVKKTAMIVVQAMKSRTRGEERRDAGSVGTPGWHRPGQSRLVAPGASTLCRRASC